MRQSEGEVISPARGAQHRRSCRVGTATDSRFHSTPLKFSGDTSGNRSKVLTIGLHRYQIAAAVDSALPRDKIVNTLYFDHTGALEDLDAFCNDLAQVFVDGWYNTASEIRVRAYDVGSAPNYPVGEGVKNAGQVGTSAGPREVALCLSYYRERNLPRQRGRIFLPNYGTMPFTQTRPPVATRNKALALATAFRNVGGIDVDWCQYSATSGDHGGVTDAYVDDEWDTLRSRGMRPTTRSTMATFSE